MDFMDMHMQRPQVHIKCIWDMYKDSFWLLCFFFEHLATLMQPALIITQRHLESNGQTDEKDQFIYKP